MSPGSLSVHAAVAPDATAGGRGGRAAAVCPRAAAWHTLTSAGTRSVRRADRTAMAIPLCDGGRAAHISPHRSPERKGGGHTGVNALAPMPQQRPGCNDPHAVRPVSAFEARGTSFAKWNGGVAAIETRNSSLGGGHEAQQTSNRRGSADSR